MIDPDKLKDMDYPSDKSMTAPASIITDAQIADTNKVKPVQEESTQEYLARRQEERRQDAR